MRLDRTGFTLVEIAVASFLGVLFLGLLVAFFINSRGQFQKPQASLLLQDTLFAGLQVIQRDLAETSIISVRCYPESLASLEPPGMSLASPRTLDGTPSRLMFSEYGAVQWQKYVYYSLRPRPNHPGLGELVRDEAALATDQPNPADVSRRIPVASAALPSQSKGTPQRRRILFRNIVLPDQPLPGGQTLDHRGGFRAQVVGETVELELIVQSDKTLSAKTTVMRLPLAIKPGNF